MSSAGEEPFLSSCSGELILTDLRRYSMNTSFDMNEYTDVLEMNGSSCLFVFLYLCFVVSCCDTMWQSKIS